MGAGNWYVSSVEASATTADTTSGIAIVEYTADGSDWQTYSPPLIFGDGAHQVQFRTFDNAGWSAETETFSFQVDTTGPHIKLPSRWYIWETGGAIVKDDTSKIASVSITISDPQNRWKKVQWNWTPNIHQFSNTISWNRVFADGIRAPIGTYNVTVQAEDNAGNRSEKTAQIIIPQPAADPLPTFTPTPTDEPTEAVVAAAVPSATPVPVVENEPKDKDPKASIVSFGSKTSNPSSTAPSTTSDNIIWGATAAAAIGAFAAAAAETKKRRDAKRARWQAKLKAKQRMQAIWDANGAAIYAANQSFKELDISSKKQAIKESTVNGVFSAALYAKNLEQASLKVNASPVKQSGGNGYVWPSEADRYNPAGSQAFYNISGWMNVFHWRSLLLDQQSGQPLPEQFYYYNFPEHGTFCTYFTTEGWRRSGIQIPDFDDIGPNNSVIYRTDENQRRTSEINGEIRYVYNDVLYGPAHSHTADELQQGYLEAFNKNPYSHLPGSIEYIKGLDYIHYRDENRPSFPHDLGNAFGHSVGVTDNTGDTPTIIEMSGPDSFVQDGGAYVGETELKSYWEAVSDAREIVERSMFSDNVPNQTVYIADDSSGRTSVDHLFTEFSIVPPQPLTLDTLQNYGINFELTPDNTYQTNDHLLSSNSPDDAIKKDCHVNPDTQEDMFMEVICLPKGVTP